jgi:hypothetical protein
VLKKLCKREALFVKEFKHQKKKIWNIGICINQRTRLIRKSKWNVFRGWQRLVNKGVEIKDWKSFYKRQNNVINKYSAFQRVLSMQSSGAIFFIYYFFQL